MLGQSAQSSNAGEGKSKLNGIIKELSENLNQAKNESLQSPKLQGPKAVELSEVQKKRLLSVYLLFRRRKDWKQFMKKMNIRYNQIKELIQTEENYNQILRLILVHFKIPLSDRQIIKEEDIQLIFGNLEQIYQLSVEFLNLLKMLYDKNQYLNRYVCIGNLMQKIFPFFKIYSDYINTVEDALQLFGKLKQKNKKFAEFCGQVERTDIVHNQDFESLANQPIQRLPRYKLVLSIIVANTQQYHPDYSDCQIGYKLILDVNFENEQRLAEFMQQKKFNEINQLTT